MSEIITLIYKHKHSAPSPDSPRASERHAPFSPSVSPADIFYARPSLFTWATNRTLNCVFGRSLDRRMRRKLPSKKPRLLQTDVVGVPGSSVALRPTTDIDAGKRPRKKVPTAENAGRNESPHSLIRWTSSTQANRTLDRKVGLSVISLHSLSRRCSGSTHMTCHLTHSMISRAKRTPPFRALLRVSWQ